MPFLRFLLISVILVSSAGIHLYGQSSMGARILILVPELIGIDDTARAELRKMIEMERPLGWEYRGTGDEGDTRKNVQLMDANRKALSAMANPSVDFAVGMQDILGYTLYETSPDIIVLVDEQGRRGDSDSLRAIASADSADYILALRSVNFGRNKGHWYAVVDIAIYETRTDSILLTHKATVGDQNTGDMFGCPDGTLDCTVKNSCREVWGQFIQTVRRRDPRVMRGW